MTRNELYVLRKMIAEREFVETIKIRLNEINYIYASNMMSIEKMEITMEDYELMTSALWESYEHEIALLKETCIKHNVSKATMMKLFM